MQVEKPLFRDGGPLRQRLKRGTSPANESALRSLADDLFRERHRRAEKPGMECEQRRQRQTEHAEDQGSRQHRFRSREMVATRISALNMREGLGAKD